MIDPDNDIGLSRDGCLARQQRLRQRLAQMNLDAALLTDDAHVMYLTNHWARSILPAVVLVPADGPVLLSNVGGPADHLVADEVTPYLADRLCTFVDDLPTQSLEPLRAKMSPFKRIGCDAPRRPWLLSDFEVVDLVNTLYAMRRHKDADEVALIRLAIKGCEAAYAAARDLLAPGVTELQVYTCMLAAAIEAVGEPIGEMGNDCQSGAPGGPPRNRPTQAGELMPLDTSVVVRGYTCDLCRTFAVDRKPTDAQLEAYRLVMAVIEHVERSAGAGVSCRKLYDEAFDMLDGKNGCKFFHHLGHGIGLFAHEAPRLNPNWDDVLEVGDVFTVEPGLYGDTLNAGIRIEHNYLVSETGLVRLSSYPTEL